jgi:hypothetical protein
MAFGGSPPNQTYTRTDGVRSGAAVNVQAKGVGVNDTAVLADVRENDLATAINALWLRNGGNQPSANLPMNTYHFTGMGAGAARTSSTRIDQVQDGDLLYAAVGGSANALELTMTPVSGGPVEGMMVIIIPESDNDDAVTADLDSAGAIAVEYNGAALTGGELQAGQPAILVSDGSVWQLANPSSVNFQPVDAGLTDIAALAVTDGNIIVGDGTNWVAESGSTARTSLGLAIGTDVQAYDAQLADVAGLTPTDGNFIVGDGANFVAESGGTALTSLGVSAFAQTVLDDADAAAALATLTALGQGLHTIVIPAGAMTSAITSGAVSAQLEASTNDQNYKVLDFDASADEYAHFQIPMPKSWNEGTITFRVFWSSTATDTDGVAWGLQGVALSDNEAIDASWGTGVVVTDDAQSAAGEVYVTAISGAVTIAGTPAEGDLVFFRVYRDVSDANDDMTEDARLIAIQLLFTINAATDA